ncbi:uncharacterized protein LOC142836435 [Microtus pennsylvanicus]|uniref:uncharacterized protein LOC142836435 n=1 Tax=Microtus pennsylvanicus TaxID=10058 RepID=UPI003F6C3976
MHKVLHSNAANKARNQRSLVSNSCQNAAELQRSCPGNSESHGDNRQEGSGRRHEANEPEHHCFLHRRRSREVKSRMLRLGTLQQEGQVSIAKPPEKQPNSSIKHPPVPTCHSRMSPSPESTHASETSGGADNVGWLPSSFGLRQQLRKARRGTEEEAVLAFLWAEAAAGPPGPPRPRCPGGLGRGGGAENSRSPAEEPRGAAAGPRRSPPRGGEGEGRGGEGEDGGARAAHHAAATVSHRGPRPPDPGWLLGWGARLIHSPKGCYGPGRPDLTVAKLGIRRARIGAAPAPGSRMCRGGRDPLPTPWGVLRPTPRGEAESPAPRGRPLPAEQLPVQTRGSSLPAPRPRAPARASAPAGAPAPACAAAAAGQEGKGGSRRRPRLPLARAEAKVSAAASARAPGLSDARSLTRFSRSLSPAAAAAAPGAQIAVSLALCGALASLQRGAGGERRPAMTQVA